MSTKFFTNQEGNTLYKKFDGIFKNTQVKMFTLIAFGKAFFKKLIYKQVK